MTKKEKAKLEAEIVKHAMLRLKEWEKNYPQGLLPRSHPDCIKNIHGWRMIRACLALKAAR